MNKTIKDKAVKIAASHFLSAVPSNATADEIFLALQAEELPEGYLLWDRFNDCDEIADLIQNLADDLINFSKFVDTECRS
jgi:hypothetical protein